MLASHVRRTSLALASIVAAYACSPDSSVPSTAQSDAAVVASSAPPTFAPKLVDVRFEPRVVRPGDEFSYLLIFENHGSLPATSDCVSFVHLEDPTRPTCERIVAQHDRAADPPARTWSAGRRVEIGPRIVVVPKDVPDGEYRVHAGLYDSRVASALVSESSLGTLRVDRAASSSDDWQPRALDATTCDARRQTLLGRLRNPVSLSGDGWSFAIDLDRSSWMLVDHRVDALWCSNPLTPRFGWVRVAKPDGSAVDVDLERFTSVVDEGGSFVCKWRPPREAGLEGVDVRVTFSVSADRRRLLVDSASTSTGGATVVSLAVLDRALVTTDAQRGYGVLPRQIGSILPTTRGLPQERRYVTYDDTSMAMFGATQGHGAILVAWDDLRTIMRTHVDVRDAPLVPGARWLSFTLELADGTGHAELWPLGRGGYVEVARAYREFATERGLVVPLAKKRESSPELERFSGAALFRATALMRSQPGGLLNTGTEEVVGLHNRFADIAAAATHWRRDLDIERALVIVRGWNRRGYDNQLPDVLPANDECGGDEALAACATSVRREGFLFGLHDNTQDMYADAPSWDECVLEADPDGKPRTAGLWEGGRAFRICSARQADFAVPNWREMSARYGVDHVFSDTILSVKLGTCAAPEHPLDRGGDVSEKQRLCELARRSFPIVGGEGGKEWGVPLLDTFEGLLSYKLFERTYQNVIPLFELVYGDCVHLQAKQEDCIDVCDAKRVVDHALYAEAPEFWFDDRDYDSRERGAELAIVPEIVGCESAANGAPRLRWRFRVSEDLATELGFFAHFRAPDAPMTELIDFQDDFAPEVSTALWRRGDVVELAPRELELRAPRDGAWDVLVGFTSDGSRRSLVGFPSQRGRHRIGVLRRENGRWSYEPAPWSSSSAAYARGADGWGRELCRADRSIKNVYELLSPLARLTEDVPMSDHRFLNEALTVERTRFGDATIVGNYSGDVVTVGDVRLPQFGVWIDSPTFVGFYALAYRGVEYPTGALFTLTSLDGEPLDRSRRVRVYHGFGGATVRIGDRVVEVEREALVEREPDGPDAVDVERTTDGEHAALGALHHR